MLVTMTSAPTSRRRSTFRLVGVADAVGPGRLGAQNVGGGVVDEAAHGRVATEGIEHPQDEVRVRLEQLGVRVGAAHDHVDVLGQVLELEVRLDRGLGVVADDGDAPAGLLTGQDDLAVGV
jgi:hypothetical protein